MFENVNWLPDVAIPDTLLSLLINTVMLIAVLIVLRALIVRFIRRTVASADLRGRWLVSSRNGFLLVLVLGLVLIWGDELRTLALSVVAIAVAFVVATKELILCLTGSILKSGSRSFTFGDRIQIKDFRGDVIDHTLLATTILEVGPGKATHQRTGRMIVIPNAVFVSEPVINESFTESYEFHVFTVPFRRGDNWRAAQQALLNSANTYCAPYLELARKHMRHVGAQQGLELPSVDPRVTIQVPVATEIHLLVRVPTKSGFRGYAEQWILSDVFAQDDFALEKRTADALE